MVQSFSATPSQLRQSISNQLKDRFKGFTLLRNVRKHWLVLPGSTPMTLDFLIDELSVAIQVYDDSHVSTFRRLAEICQICGINFFMVRDEGVVPAIIQLVSERKELPYYQNSDWRFAWTYRDPVSKRLIYEYVGNMVDSLEKCVRANADPYAPYFRMSECWWRHTRINPLRNETEPLAIRAAEARVKAEYLLKRRYPQLWDANP